MSEINPGSHVISTVHTSKDCQARCSCGWRVVYLYAAFPGAHFHIEDDVLRHMDLVAWLRQADADAANSIW